MPYSSRFVSGLGVWNDELVVSLSLVAVPHATDRESTGILLKTPGSTTRWALEISAPIGLLTVSNVVPPTQITSSRPAWLLSATTATERTLLWIDVDEMVRAAEHAT